MIDKYLWFSIRPSFLVFMNAVRNNMLEKVGDDYVLDVSKRRIVRGVEVGVKEGLNAVQMLSACPDLDLTLVDIDDCSMLQQHIQQYAYRTKFIQGPSVEVAKQFPDEYFDYIYIDAAHDYESVRQDLIAWYPKIKLNGVFAGHDWWYKGVADAVNNFFNTGCKIPNERVIVCAAPSPGPIPSTDAEIMDWWVVMGLTEEKKKSEAVMFKKMGELQYAICH